MSGFDGKAVVYGASLFNRGGTGVYVRRLLEGFVDLGTSRVSVALGGALLDPHAALGTGRRYGTLGKLIQENLRAPSLAASASADIVHLPAFGGRPPRGCPYVVTLHDLAFMDRPASFPAIRSLYYRSFFGRIAGRASLVMVDSDFTGKEAVRLLGLSYQRVRTVHLCTTDYRADPRLFRERYGLDGEYLICVGTIEPRKNVDALLLAWKRGKGSMPVEHLVVAGRWGWGGKALRRRLRAEPGVVWTGELEESLLKSAVSGARLMVYPSLYEGFGLPPLEAASAGVPSVVGPAEALREVYGRIAFQTRSGDPDSISAAIAEALSSAVDPEELRAFASEHTVGRMSTEVLRVYGEATT